MVACDLSGEGQIANVFKCGFEPIEVVSAVLEMPKVILGLLRALSLIMIRNRIQWSSILRIVSRDDAYHMRVRSHNHSSVPRWNAPPPVVSNYAGCIVDPAIEVEA